MKEEAVIDLNVFGARESIGKTRVFFQMPNCRYQSRGERDCHRTVPGYSVEMTWMYHTSALELFSISAFSSCVGPEVNKLTFSTFVSRTPSILAQISQMGLRMPLPRFFLP